MGKAARQQSARERMREERRRQQARARTMRRMLIGGAVVVVVAIAVGIGVFVQTQRASGDGEFTGQLPPGTKVDGGTAVAIAKSGVNKPVLTVWEDFQCPVCQQFEQRSGDTIKQLVANGKVKVVYHPMAIIDQRSVRAGSAALVAADHGKFMEYHDLLYQNQAPENASTGFETDKLQKYGNKVGISSQKFDKAIKQQKYRNVILQNTAKGEKQPNYHGTPNIYLNGKQLSNQIAFNPDALKDKILSADSK